MQITFDLDQLPEPDRLQLRDSLLAALTQDSTISSKIILVQICLSLADLALQLPQWPTVITDLIEKFGKLPQTVPILLEFLTVFPQEIIGNSKIKITVRNPLFISTPKQFKSVDTHSIRTLMLIFFF
jgi:transportin-3